MEKLKIFNGSKDDDLIEFDEMLEENGDFLSSADTLRDGFYEKKNEVKLLDYRSSIYDYYIHEAKDGEHTIYRNKK